MSNLLVCKKVYYSNIFPPFKAHKKSIDLKSIYMCVCVCVCVCVCTHTLKLKKISSITKITNNKTKKLGSIN